MSSRRRWPLAPERSLIGLGVLAIVVVMLAVPACGASQEPLYIEGVEIEGPVAVYRKWDTAQQAEGASESRVTIFAIDLATGLSWDIYAAPEPVVAEPAGDRLVVWSPESLATRSVSLDGTSEVLLHPGGALAPYVSFDGSKVAFAVDGTPLGEPESVVVLDVPSGDEVVRVEADDPRIDAPASGSEAQWALEVTRWSVDGASLLAGGRGAGAFVLTLDGEVHKIPYRSGYAFFLSPDLRHYISSEGTPQAATSLIVTELSTGRALLTLTPGEGELLMHGAGPVSAKYVYTSFPDGAQHRDPSQGRRVSVGHVVDLETGETTLLSEDKELLGDWEWIWGLQGRIVVGRYWGIGGVLTPCYFRHQAVDPCLDLDIASQEGLQFIYRDQELQERSISIRTTELLGFIWLD